MFSVSLTSCVNLKRVNDLSKSSLESIKLYEKLEYSFTQSCIDNCLDERINALDITSPQCNCTLDEKADEVTLRIYNTIKAYYDGLAKLSDNALTDYKMDPLLNAITEGNFGSVVIKKEDAEAYSKISKILLKAFTDGYRKKKIKEYVTGANESIKILTELLKTNIKTNLYQKLEVKKQRIKTYYFDLVKDPALAPWDRALAVREYYSRLSKIEIQQKQLTAYSSVLDKVKTGHHDLSVNIDKLSKAEIKALLAQYASDIQDIISEYNKLKHN